MVKSPPASVAELKSVATKFRLAIERCGPSRLSIPFEKFPEGSCGEAAQLLRTFLQKRGLGTFKYVSGFHDKEGRHITHAWLEAGWIPARDATPSTALVPQEKAGFPIPNPRLLLGFQGTKTARREGTSSPFSDAGVALRVGIQDAVCKLDKTLGNQS
jgi:hypothetical protein